MSVFTEGIQRFFYGAFLYFFDSFDVLFSSYLALAFIGFIIFSVSSLVKRTLNRKSLLNYLGQKLMSLTLVAVAVILQRIIPMDMSLRELTLLFLIINQCADVLKLADDVIPVPKRLTDYLKDLQSENKKSVGSGSAASKTEKNHDKNIDKQTAEKQK